MIPVCASWDIRIYPFPILALRLLGSSTTAVLQIIKEVYNRLQSMEDAQEEPTQWQEMQAVADSIP